MAPDNHLILLDYARDVKVNVSNNRKEQGLVPTKEHLVFLRVSSSHQ